MYQISQFKIKLILINLLLVSCQLDDNQEDNHIEFYNQNADRTSSASSSLVNGKFSIFHKRTRPIFRKNTKHLMNKYKITPDDQQVNISRGAQQSNFVQRPASSEQFISSVNQPVRRSSMKLNKSKASVEFIDVYDRPNHDEKNSTANKIESLSYAQQTMLAFEHGLRIKREAKCELPKPTVVYLNQDKEQIKIYTPRATILHRCGINTGCCASESEQCKCSLN